MVRIGENTNTEKVTDTPAIHIDIMRLRPIEIVLLSRVPTESTTNSFPAIDQYANDFGRQLRNLPTTDPAFAREVCSAFAQSTFAADRYSLAQHMVQSMTLADHDFGFALWHQLVRDEHSEVQLVAYSDVDDCLRGNQAPAEGLAELGLTLDDAHELRDAFIGAQYGTNLHVIGHTALAADLQEAVRSFQGFANLD